MASSRRPAGTGQAPDQRMEQPSLGVDYLCGDCGATVKLRPGDIIRCRDCGYRILYKKRTDRVVQFEAR
ncbi:hypothetical protein WJX74_010829 [Apatococcus lobatus]|uniref:Uncharacterized protein n=1 Tax=Apatococcus lobatus TaxID=904363 RepID=A0AAW1RWA8_9CHLO